MVEQDEYCVDIMQQNLAAIGLLKSAHERVMKDHLETCFVDGVQKGSVKKQKELIEELQTLMKLYNK
jgi:DNA-binding FrmR family transcriptional regulator